MKKRIIVIALCVFSLPALAQRVTELKTDKEKLSYSLGVNIAQNLKQQNMDKDLDVKIFNQAMNDVLSGTKLVFSEDSISKFMNRYISIKREEYTKKIKELGEKNKVIGQKFLEDNKKKKGVITTASGLQYEILTKGKSVGTPKPEDIVKVKYEGRLIDGTVFDSTQNNNNGEAIEFPLNRVIKGWTEGVGLMTKGSKYRFFVPSDLAYGEREAGTKIEPNSVLIFDIELVDFKAAPKDDASEAK
ncbi:FKBP-type peptidyl-prolyl cis-trans isomerase [Apibacter adventoris]|uniref:FKBP-type peptidyl-prolyl cis-trans isomerase n=1 Tax=Apibacter adventoris TaxID=1679466 RepID=UPI000CF73002|nr:FKBP-type peptidyl-prolyl cis-trans isomerase [Apibacter adventoris]PQL94079.1 hypothetical protein C4S76_06825 [Apibacter adventoris]